MTADRKRPKPVEVPRLQSTGEKQTEYDGGNVARGHAQMLAMAAGQGKVQGV